MGVFGVVLAACTSEALMHMPAALCSDEEEDPTSKEGSAPDDGNGSNGNGSNGNNGNSGNNLDSNGNGNGASRWARRTAGLSVFLQLSGWPHRCQGGCTVDDTAWLQ